MKISIRSSGSFSKTEKFIKTMSKSDVFKQLESVGKEGIAALAAATPKDSGGTAGSWGFQIKGGRGRYTMEWTNSNIVAGVPIVVLLQYGHGTGTGGYVQGRDFINPAMRPIFDKIADRAWKVVVSA